jgi:hypothetical protein
MIPEISIQITLRPSLIAGAESTGGGLQKSDPLEAAGRKNGWDVNPPHVLFHLGSESRLNLEKDFVQDHWCPLHVS